MSDNRGRDGGFRPGRKPERKFDSKDRKPGFGEKRGFSEKKPSPQKEGIKDGWTLRIRLG